MFEGGALHDLEGKDTLVEYSKHLGKTYDDRLTAWPHALLLLGDQIYADDVAQSVIEKIEERRRKRKTAGKAGPDYLENTYSPNFKKIDTHLRTGLVDKLEAGTARIRCAQERSRSAARRSQLTASVESPSTPVPSGIDSRCPARAADTGHARGKPGSTGSGVLARRRRATIITTTPSPPATNTQLP